MVPSVQIDAAQPAKRKAKRATKVRVDLFDDDDDFFPRPRTRKSGKDVLLFDDIDLLSDEW
jgi:hypothetical protein